MKVCITCGSKKSNNDFHKKKTEEYGFGKECKSCLKIKRTARQVSKADAEKFIVEQETLGTLYTCSDCKNEMTASNFYYKRDYGKVYVNYTKCRKCTTAHQRFRAFGITKEDYEEMLDSQNRSCKVCEIPIEEYQENSQNNKVFAVDHCHKTGRIRGLLCCKCNRGLGYFKDDLELLKRAIEYLK